MSKLFFLSALDPLCSNLVMLFKSSLQATNPPQNPKLLLTPLLKTILLLVTSQAPSAHLPTPPTGPLVQSLFLPHPPMTASLSSTPAGSLEHPLPYSSTVVTIDPEPSTPQEPTLPALPSAPATPSPFSSPPVSHTSSQACPAHLYPLQEVAGADSIIRVHVPFSMTDLSQIEKKLGSFSNDSACYIKEFKYLTQAYDMAWHDIYVILSSTLTPDEKERV
jgi:hypothetical protein